LRTSAPPLLWKKLERLIPSVAQWLPERRAMMSATARTDHTMLRHFMCHTRVRTWPVIAGVVVALALLSGTDTVNARSDTPTVTNGPLTIIKVERQSERSGIYTLGRPPQRLFECAHTRGCYWLESVDWAPDGRRLAFSVTTINMTSGYNGVHVIDTVTGKDRRIGPRDGFDLDWSPDGSRLAYVEWAISGFGRPHGLIYVMRADGSGRRLLRTGTAGRDSSPSWSPTGNRIAYSTRGNGRSSVYVIGLDGSHRRLLVTQASAPAWSPSGARIAYRTGCGGVKLVTPAGEDVTPPGRPVPCRAIGVSGVPVWSPDGRKIAVTTNKGIYVMDADGSDLTLVTTQTGKGIIGTGRPTWRPLR
jgi:WD40-like Beta Propeller Repeat